MTKHLRYFIRREGLFTHKFHGPLALVPLGLGKVLHHGEENVTEQRCLPHGGWKEMEGGKEGGRDRGYGLHISFMGIPPVTFSRLHL